jgi:hypothetical protein
VQSFLQAGTPDHDVLVYYPFYDALADRGSARLAHFGGANPPARGTPFEETAELLQRRGYTYDFISDMQLATTRVRDGRLIPSSGNPYKTLVVPASRFIPLATFERIVALARDGATIVAFKGLPARESGLAAVLRSSPRFDTLRNNLHFDAPDSSSVSNARIGRGSVMQGPDLERLLARAGISRETLVDRGLEFSRRKYGNGRAYFIVNSSERDVEGTVTLDDRAASAVVFDPMTGRRGDLSVARSASGTLDVQVAIGRGASLIVTTAAAAAAPAPFYKAVGEPVAIRGPWRIAFTTGGPALPAGRTIERLSSWTSWGGDDLISFSGTARYETTFPRPPGEAAAWQLDLGTVHESAHVRLNGREMGTLIGPSFRVVVDRGELAAENVLQVEVSNLMANRIAAMDRAGIRWRKFYNVNFPARLPQNRGRDGLYSAASWQPLDSGLVGPVTLTPVNLLK